MRSSGLPRTALADMYQESSTVWMFWEGELPPFETQCVENIRHFNPSWQVVLLDVRSAQQLVGAHMLPRSFERLPVRMQSDSVRLAVLATFGGAYVDVSTIFVRRHALRTMYNEMVAGGYEMRGYVYTNGGCGDAQDEWWLSHPPLNPEGVFENWFIMARRGAKLISQWHAVFNLYWDPRTESENIRGHDLFAGIRMYFDNWGRVRADSDVTWVEYLTQHRAFKRVWELQEWQGEQWRSAVLVEDACRGPFRLSDSTCRWSKECVWDRLMECDAAGGDKKWLAHASPLTPFVKFPTGYRIIKEKWQLMQVLASPAQPLLQSILWPALQPEEPAAGDHVKPPVPQVGTPSAGWDALAATYPEDRTLWVFVPEMQTQSQITEIELRMQRLRSYANSERWPVIPLNATSAMHLLGAEMLPCTFADLEPAVQSAAVQVAALAIFGGAFIDAQMMEQALPKPMDQLYDEMVDRDVEVRGLRSSNSGIPEAWFMMARRHSVIMSNIHYVFKLYWDTRMSSSGIADHDIFAPVRDWAAAKAIDAAGMTEELSLARAVLRVQALEDWRDGAFERRVILDET